jgi:hypothetical protein
MKKNVFCNFKKHILFTTCFWPIPWLCISNMIRRAGEAFPITFEITQNGEELKKICQNVRSWARD